ncbi:MAG: hypothetical protein JWQ01_1013, partial [Massilia sp.]|nr:hypothetical protein [Massilia sp.]
RVDLLEYRKGPFYASEGDFAAAGAVHVSYVNKLDQGIASLGMGSNGFARSSRRAPCTGPAKCWKRRPAWW